MASLSKGGYQAQKQKPNRNRRKNANAECLKPGPGLLKRAQGADMTQTGLCILKGDVNRIMTLKEQEKVKVSPVTPCKIRILLDEPFNLMSIITKHLGLTGLGGLVQELFQQFEYPVKCVINVTYELPVFKVAGIETYRIPVSYTF